MLKELAKRKVPGVVTGYAVACFVVLQIADVTFDALGLTAEHVRLLLIGMIAGLPIVAYLAWRYDLKGGKVETERSSRPVLELGFTVALSVGFFVGALYVWPPKPEAEDLAQRVNAPGRLSLDAIAVLPFRNLSSDENQAFLADGIGRDLADLLAQIPSLRVIPMVTTEAYGEKVVPATAVGQELDARFIVSGGLEKRGERFRLRATLTDAEQDELLWSENYDEAISTFYDVQDRITQGIATSLSTELDVRRSEALAKREVFDLGAYEHIQLAEEGRRFYSKEAARTVVRELQLAVEAQPENAIAHAALSEQYAQNLVSRFSDDPAQTVGSMSRHLERAQSLAPNDPRVLRAVAVVALMSGDYEESHAASKRSLEINPNDPHTMALSGFAVGYLGQIDDGLELLRRAEEVAPRHPRYGVWAAYRSSLHYLNRDYIKYADAYKQASQRNPDYHLAYFNLALAYAHLGNQLEITSTLRKGLKIAPDYTPEEFRSGLTRLGFGLVFSTPEWELLRAAWEKEQAALSSGGFSEN